MTAALTPALALAYLDQMSADIEAAIVVDLQGEVLAGPPVLAAPARALLDAAEPRERRAASAGDTSPATFDGGDSGSAAVDGDAESGPISPPGDASRVTLVSARCPRGFALAARDARHAVVVAAGPLALEQLVLHDLETVLAALGGGAAERVLATAPALAAEALLSAVPYSS